MFITSQLGNCYVQFGLVRKLCIKSNFGDSPSLLVSVKCKKLTRMSLVKVANTVHKKMIKNSFPKQKTES